MAAIKLTKNQRDLAMKLGGYAIILIIVSSVAIYLSGTVDDYQRKHTWLKNDIADLNGKLSGLNKKTLEFSEAVKTWESMSEEDKNLQGLRINDAKDLLDKLQEKYKISSVKISFSKPEEILGDYTTDTVVMISSIISMSFDAISDEFAYKFIEDITSEFPGYVQIKSFSIKEATPVTKEIIKKISIGEDVSIIPVTLEFYWHDLKYKGTRVQSPVEGEDSE